METLALAPLVLRVSGFLDADECVQRGLGLGLGRVRLGLGA